MTKLPSHSQTELPANVLRDVNQAVTAVLQKEAGGNEEIRESRKRGEKFTYTQAWKEGDAGRTT